LLAGSEQYIYRELSLADFINQYQHSLPEARLFELTLPWLAATANFMVGANKVIIHCLYKRENTGDAKILIAWPLVHDHLVKQISSLTSFYSALAEPIVFEKPNKEIFHQLISSIEQGSTWHSMLFGPLENRFIQASLNDYFAFKRIFF
jgi:hypothetical protein